MTCTRFHSLLKSVCRFLKVSFDGVSARVQTSGETPFKCVDTLLICGLRLRFFLLLLLGSGLCRLLLGRFVGFPLPPPSRHSPGSGSSSCSSACFIVSSRSYCSASCGAPGSTLGTSSFRLLGIVGSGLLFCFLLLLGLSWRGRSLGVNSQLLFSRSETLVFILQEVVNRNKQLTVDSRDGGLRCVS